MNLYGATREDFGKLCVAQRDNALSIPFAMMKKKLTLDDYMKARPISDPLHLFDCVMPCAGAEAFLVCREDVAKSLGLPACACSRPSSGTMPFPTIRSSIAAAGRWTSTSCGRWPASSPPMSICVETYDDYPVIVTMQFEDLGFCEKGEGPDFVRSHTLHHRRHVPAQHLGRSALGRAGRRRRRLSRHRRGDAAARRHAARQAGRGRQARRRLRLRYDQLRSRPVVRRRRAREGLT